MVIDVAHGFVVLNHFDLAMHGVCGPWFEGCASYVCSSFEKRCNKKGSVNFEQSN